MAAEVGQRAGEVGEEGRVGRRELAADRHGFFGRGDRVVEAAEVAVVEAEAMRAGEVIEEGRIGGGELAERVDSSWSGIGTMAPDIPPQIGRRLWLQATGQKFEVAVNEGRRDRCGLLLSGVDSLLALAGDGDALQAADGRDGRRRDHLRHPPQCNDRVAQ